MSIDRGMDKDEYYSAIKKSEIISITWIDLEISILNEVRQRKQTS